MKRNNLAMAVMLGLMGGSIGGERVIRQKDPVPQWIQDELIAKAQAKRERKNQKRLSQIQ